MCGDHFRQSVYDYDSLFHDLAKNKESNYEDSVKFNFWTVKDEKPHTSSIDVHIIQLRKASSSVFIHYHNQYYIKMKHLYQRLKHVTEVIHNNFICNVPALKFNSFYSC